MPGGGGGAEGAGGAQGAGMAARRKAGAAMYDLDDFDDGYYDEEEYYEDYGPPKPKAPPQKPKAGGAKAPGPSSMGRGVCQAAPKPAGGARGRAVKAENTRGFPAAPGAGRGFGFTSPSPDEEALQARNGSAGAGAASASASASASATPARRPLSEYDLEAELAEACFREPGGAPGSLPALSLVVLGHVDAGKSTLMGRLLSETGAVAKERVHRLQRDAGGDGGAGGTPWAWVLDERAEERSRGVTVDVASARFSTSRRSVRVLDAPGHRDFVPNAIAGASQADAALLVVDGAVGGFEKGFSAAPGGALGRGGGQTREHVQLARCLGISQLAVCVTKLDTLGGAGYPGAQAAQERFEAVRQQLEPFLSKAGFRTGAVQWLPASGRTGDNLVGRPASPELAWYQGPTVSEAVDAFEAGERRVEMPLRMPVAEVLPKSRELGATPAAGRLEAGALVPSTEVRVAPSGRVVKVKKLQSQGEPRELARAGDAVELGLLGLEEGELRQGDVLCHPSFPVPVVRRLEARVVTLDIMVPLLKGSEVVVHAHVAAVAGQVAEVRARLDPKTGAVQKERPRCVTRHQAALLVLELERPLCLEKYSDYKGLGRVTLRDGGHTVAVGTVTELLEYE